MRLRKLQQCTAVLAVLNLPCTASGDQPDLPQSITCVATSCQQLLHNAAVSAGSLLQVVVPSKAQASLSVAVRVRPILNFEQAGNKRDIVRVIDGKIVVILDPDEVKDYLDQVQNRTKEKKYTFDVAFDTKVCFSS